MVFILLLAVLYLFYRVHCLEQQVESSRHRQRTNGSAAPGKVIPILKREIEPGPYRARNGRESERPENRPEP